ncbi:hypothetical protein Q9Q95_11455 [Sphingomonas sp. DG1-23]|uniref:hypothetical protein n=1 Tax=Sphingomonas sp. DG1-23 TaxID=3068316 RepID=UPI00273E6D1C|nr:hypothetical protein [Sphingomonas sp. DG1-23]MDP5279540.1 hypothetical protein [Sphingomonas sp. DG1-23]
MSGLRSVDRPHRAGMFVVGLSILLAGCESPPKQCQAVPDGWLDGKSKIPELAPINRLHLARDGSMRWNGMAVTSAAVRGILLTTARDQPRPFLLLDYDSGLSCDQIYRFREFVDQAYQCRAGNCGEGELKH